MFMQTDEKNINPHKSGQGMSRDISKQKECKIALNCKNLFILCTFHQTCGGFSPPSNSLDGLQFNLIMTLSTWR